MYGHTEIVSLLLSCNDIVLTRQYQGTDHTGAPHPPQNVALYCAAREGHVEVVSVLLADHRFSPNTSVSMDGSPTTALDIATCNGHSSVVRMMLADPRINVNELTGFRKGTALHSAVCNYGGHESLVQYFLDEPRVELNTRDGMGQTPVHRAVANGEVTNVRLLVADPRVELNTIDTYGHGRSPLLTACNGWWVCEEFDKCSLEERVGMIAALLQSKTIDTAAVDKEGNTCLVTCLTGHDSPYSADIAAAMGMEFLKRGIGLDQVSTWFGIDKLSFQIRFWLYRNVQSLQKNWQQPMLTFHLSRLSTAHNANSESSLRVFNRHWPLLIGEKIEDFCFPKKKYRVGFQQILAEYKASVRNVEGYAMKMFLEISQVEATYGTKYNHDLDCFLKIGPIDINTLLPPGSTGLKLSPMKDAKRRGADINFLAVFRKFGGLCISQDGDAMPVHHTTLL